MWCFVKQHLYTGGDDDDDVCAGHVSLFGAGNWRPERLAGDSPLPVPHVFVPASLPSEDRWN